jgi:hypothetical protein
MLAKQSTGSFLSFDKNFKCEAQGTNQAQPLVTCQIVPTLRFDYGSWETIRSLNSYRESTEIFFYQERSHPLRMSVLDKP